MKTKIMRELKALEFFLKQHKNDILFGAGVVTEVAAVVVAGKAAVKRHEEANMLAEQLDRYVDCENDSDERKEINAEARRAIYRSMVKSTVKNSAAPVLLTIVSVLFLSKSHINLKDELAKVTAALAVEHAMNQRLLADQVDIPKEAEAAEEPTNGPYSAGIPNDLETQMLDRGVVIYDSDTKYFGEKDGYAEPTKIFLSPCTMVFKKDKLSSWEPCFEWNISHIINVMRDIVSRYISLYGFNNLNDIRKEFCAGRSVKLEEAENYYLLYDSNRHRDDQVFFRIYGNCNEDGYIYNEELYIDIFNTKIPKPGELKEAKRRAIEENPMKD